MKTFQGEVVSTGRRIFAVLAAVAISFSVAAQTSPPTKAVNGRAQAARPASVAQSSVPVYWRRTAPDGAATIFLVRAPSATCAPDPKTQPDQFAYFHSSSRFSSDPEALPPTSIIQYQWELLANCRRVTVDGSPTPRTVCSGPVILAGPIGTVNATTTPKWNVPSWGVPKCAIISNSAVHLTLTRVQ